MSHVFISYSKHDAKFAQYLKGLLEETGFPVWMDESSIYTSAYWSKAIEQNILTCSAFIIIMSPQAKESEWCEREILLAEREKKPIFPVLLDGDVWFRLANIQYADMRDSYRRDLPEQLQHGLAQIFMGEAPSLGAVLPGLHVPEKRKIRPWRWPRRRVFALVGLVLVAGLAAVLVWSRLSPSAAALNPHTRIAFISVVNGQPDLWVMQVDRSSLQRLTNDPAEETDPSWLASGARLAFASNLDGNYEIYASNYDGSNRVRLTDDPTSDGSPAWSPDGSQLAFVRYSNGNNEIFVMNADGSDPYNLTRHASSDYAPTWSPDGSQLAFWSDRLGDPEIFIMNSDGSGARRLTNNGLYGYTVSWSPDGQQLVFDMETAGNYDVYVIKVDGTSQRQLTLHPGNDGEPAWSPDGQFIVFVSERDGNKELYGMTAEGANQHNLIYNIANDFSPDVR